MIHSQELALPCRDPEAYGISRNQILANFSEYIQDGKHLEGIPGIEYEGLKYARIARHKLTKTALQKSLLLLVGIF